LDNFYKTLQSESTRAFYGINHVEKANEVLGIETLLITDSLFRSVHYILSYYYSLINVSLFRSQNIAERKRYVKLVDSVKESGGDVKIFSSMHVTGERK